MALNIIDPTYMIISEADEGKGGTAFLFHPSLTLVDSGSLDYGKVAWAQFKLDNASISIATIYMPNDSVRARAYL